MNRIDPWFGIPENEITHCVRCGTKIWERWNIDIMFGTKCGPCLGDERHE